MAKKRDQKKQAPVPAGDSPPSQAPVVLTDEQRQAAARLQTAHAVLKAKFADVSVDLDIVAQERDQLMQRVRQSQKIIEKLSQELQEARLKSEPEPKE